MEGEPHPKPVETPCINIESNEGTIQLHWFNTRIRLFGNAMLNHVEWLDQEEQLRGLRVTQEFMDLLMKNSFPYSFDPVPDPATEKWFMESETRNLDDEWEQFDSE